MTIEKLTIAVKV